MAIADPKTNLVVKPTKPHTSRRRCTNYYCYPQSFGDYFGDQLPPVAEYRCDQFVHVSLGF